MKSNMAYWATRWDAVEMPWLTLRSLCQRASDRAGYQLSESVIRKYLKDIGSRPEDRAFIFHEHHKSDDSMIVLLIDIEGRDVTIDWPENARRRPGGVLLDTLLRISVPRRPPLFVEIAADWLTGRIWLTTHRQEPERARYNPLNRAVTELKEAGFHSDFVVSTWRKYFNYDPDGQEYIRLKLKRSDENSLSGKDWRVSNRSSNYLLTPLSDKTPIFPINFEVINQVAEQRAKLLEDNFSFWPSSFDRSIEKEINTTALTPGRYVDPGLTPTKFWDACVEHLDRRWPKLHRKSVRP